MLKRVLLPRCRRENKTISLGWKTRLSSGNNEFKILERSNAEEDLPLFVSEFWWQNKLCFANFFDDGDVVVYQSHCLLRYAERVLKESFSASDVFYNHIVKRQAAAYHIVLPAKTHKFCTYFGIAKALFLGDFEAEHPKEKHVWLNTCISYDEAKYSQSKIMHSLHELQSFIEREKCNLSDPKEKQHLLEYLKKYSNNDDKLKRLGIFLTQYFLLLKLHLSFEFPFTETFRGEIDARLKYLKESLSLLNISTHELSPYSKAHGIAWKGEIDYNLM